MDSFASADVMQRIMEWRTTLIQICMQIRFWIMFERDIFFFYFSGQVLVKSLLTIRHMCSVWAASRCPSSSRTYVLFSAEDAIYYHRLWAYALLTPRKFNRALSIMDCRGFVRAPNSTWIWKTYTLEREINYTKSKYNSVERDASFQLLIFLRLFGV